MSRTESQDLEQPVIFPGGDLEERATKLGRSLGAALGEVVQSLPGSPLGPQRLATLLHTTIVNTSRLLKSISGSNPLRTLRHLPGPEPLRKILSSARSKGADKGAIKRAMAAVDEFEDLIRREGGDRGSFDAIMSAWLPEERHEFLARRRQAAFKALSELRGVSSEIDLSCLLLHPSPTSERIDVAVLQGQYGLRRMRPKVVVKFGTRRLSREDHPRQPRSLDGVLAGDGISGVRLDEFCVAPPAPLESRVIGDSVLYTIGETGFGPQSAVDIVLGEVNHGELTKAGAQGGRFFYHLVGTPTKKAAFDVLVHKSVFAGVTPRLVVIDATSDGPASPADEIRQVDHIEVTEEIETLASGLDAAHGAEIPRYAELLRTSCDKLGWNLRDMRAFRIRMDHPLLGMQICLWFPTSP